jgi:hypothetical protein
VASRQFLTLKAVPSFNVHPVWQHGGKLHRETLDGLNDLKTLVGRLARPRWIDWAILIVGAIAANGVIILLFPAHSH